VVREYTSKEFLLGFFALAREGLRKKSIDELTQLKKMVLRFPREEIPPEIITFLKAYRRPRGTMKSKQRDVDRFHSDPNRIAAHWASLFVEKKKAVSGAYKVINAAGSRVTLHDWAVQEAVDLVNKSCERAGLRRKARSEAVKVLLRKGRTSRPTWDVDPDNSDN
jgi:hypothetical protein